MMCPVPARALVALQRVLLVALLAPVVLIAAAAAIPAFALLPLLPNGTDRAVTLMGAYTAYARTLLSSSQPAPAPRHLDQLAGPHDTRDPAPRRIAGIGLPTGIFSPVNLIAWAGGHDPDDENY